MTTWIANNAPLIGFGGLLLGIFGAVLAVVGSHAAAKTRRNLGDIAKQNELLKVQLVELQALSLNIADSTRKPLAGFAEIFCHCEQLVTRSLEVVGGRIWFVGMTLGMGCPHKYKRVTDALGDKTMNQIMEHVHPRRVDFDHVINSFHTQIRAKLPSSSKPVIVCLNKARLGPDFLEPLSKRDHYRGLAADIDTARDDTLELHDKVEEKLGRDGVSYVDAVPIQLVVAEIPDRVNPDAPPRMGCVVFLVGTENIGSSQLVDGEQGFYSELPSVCSMFVEVAESLSFGS